MKKTIPKPVRSAIKHLSNMVLWDSWATRTWSQEGEDRILQRIFENRQVGFYVDIGAHHPQRFSNTYLFYKHGWSGINIDAMPGSMQSFNQVRPRDINLELGIADQKAELDYYVFNEPALNGFLSGLSQERHTAESAYLIEDIVKVNVMPLREVLDQYLPAGQGIDFMSVDVEGLDFEVLKSNDWDSYRPSFVLAEVLGSSLHEIQRNKISQFMNNIGYVLYAKCMNTVFFKESSYKIN
jgi:FkbM family methyltransferase